MRNLFRLALLSALALCTLSCRHLPWSAQSRDERCLVSLLPSQQIAETFRLRQRFVIRLGDESHRVDIVAERRGESFVVVGFTPFGTRGFVLTQTGREISLDDRIGRRMGLRPLLLLDAIHRSYLMAPEGGLPPDGVTLWLREGAPVQLFYFSALVPMSAAFLLGSRETFLWGSVSVGLVCTAWGLTAAGVLEADAALLERTVAARFPAAILFQVGFVLAAGVAARVRTATLRQAVESQESYQ